MVINVAGITVDLDEPTLEEYRNEKSNEGVEKPIEIRQNTDTSHLGVDNIDDTIVHEQYQAFLTDPRRI